MDIFKPANSDKRFQEVLEILGIAKRLHHKPRARSGGSSKASRLREQSLIIQQSSLQTNPRAISILQTLRLF
jgi:ABC-type sugar transport system ATPase subunit